LSYFTNSERLAAMEHGEVRSVVALKRGVGDHSAERFADHELGSYYCGGFEILELLCGPQGRAIPACGDTSTLELLCGPHARAILA
jgi:hypothetical protein